MAPACRATTLTCSTRQKSSPPTRVDWAKPKSAVPPINVVPKTGGNTFKGLAYVAGVSSGMVSSNYSPELKAPGLASPLSILKLWDVTGGVGGPIKKDRVWFFANYRDEGSWQTIPGIFANKNFENVTTPIANADAPWTVVPDPDVPAMERTAGDIAAFG